MLEQRQHVLLNYFKTLSGGPAGNRTRASRTADWLLTNLANQVAVLECGVLIMKRGKLVKLEGVIIPDGQGMREVEMMVINIW